MDKLIFITCSPKATLDYNIETKVFEIWQDGRRICEILTDDKESAIKTFKLMFA